MAKRGKKDTTAPKEPEDNTSLVRQRLGPSGLHPIPHYLESGVFMFDLAMGRGYPCGHITEIFGEEGTGKTLLGLMACYQTLLQSGDAVYMDVESRLDLSLAQGYVGIDNDDAGWHYYPHQEDGNHWTMEAATNKITELVTGYKPGSPLTIVVDSIAALSSIHIDEDMMNKTYANMKLSNQWSRWFRDTGIISKIRGKEIYLIFLNQIRDAPNMFQRGPTQPATAGGRAMKFYCSVRVELDSFSPKSDDTFKSRFDKEFCQMIKAVVKKNSVSAPNRHAIFPHFHYNTPNTAKGIDNVLSMMSYLREKGYMKSGQWWEFEGEKYRYFDLRNWIRDNPEGMKLCKDKVVEAYLNYYST